MNPEIKACVAIGKTRHGKWSYRTVVIYDVALNKKGEKIWKKNRIVWEATTHAKIQRLAEQVAKEQGLPLMLNIRHNDKVAE